MKIWKLFLPLAVVGLLSGCATPTVVERERPEDYKLSCKELESGMREAEDFRQKAEKEKGLTGTNVAAALFFWPAMIGTHNNANEAIDAANERKRHLMEIYNENGCRKQESKQISPSTP